MASKSEPNNESADKSHITTINTETNSLGDGRGDLSLASLAKKMDEVGGQVEPLPNQTSNRTADLNRIESAPVRLDTPLAPESNSKKAEPVDSKGDPQSECNRPKQESLVGEVEKAYQVIKEITPSSSAESESSESPDDVSEPKKEVSVPPPPVQTQIVSSAIGDLEDDIPIVPVQGHPTQPKKQDTSPNFIDSFARWLADCEGSSAKPPKKADRRQQRHTASTTSYVPRNLSLSANTGRSERQNRVGLSGNDSTVPKFERLRSISGNVEVSKSLTPGEEESDDVMSCEDAEPSESDGVSKVDELTQPVDDIPCVVSSQPVLFQEESLQSAPKDSESVLEGSGMESESISGASESLSCLNKIVRDEEGETIDKKAEGEAKEAEEGDEKKTPEGEVGTKDEAGEQDEDRENLEEEAKDSLGKLEEMSPKKKKTRRGSIGFGVIPSGQDALIMGQPGGEFPPEKLYEYQWPQDKGDFFMLQEQISEYLGVKSFKRKYPDLPRRMVDIMERNFLKDKGIVTEMQCDLGLTAVRSEDVLDLMQRDYEDKYKEYTLVLQEREAQKMKEKTKGYEQLSKELLQPTEKSKMAEFIKRAVKSAAEFNSQFMRELREERKAYYDIQTQDIQFPLGRCKRLPKEATKVGAYPVAVIPGQYQDYYKKYSSHELKYFPLNSAIYGPPKKFNTIFADPNEPTDSESEGSVASHTSSGSGSGSDTGSSSPSSNQETPMDTSAAPAEESAQDMKPEPEPEGPKCKMCEEVKVDGQDEELVICSECKGRSHPSCLELTPAMVEIIKTYPWQCMECKTCVECMDPGDEDKMMFCDQCDRGYHTFCVGLQRIPGGKWECHSCRKIEAPTPIRKKRKYERKPKVEDGEDGEGKETKKVKREKKDTPLKVKKEKKEKVTKAETPQTEKKERKRRGRKEKPKE